MKADGNELLTDAGRISAEIARRHAENEFEKYRIIQDKLFRSDFDRFLEEKKRDDQEDKDGSSE